MNTTISQMKTNVIFHTNLLYSSNIQSDKNLINISSQMAQVVKPKKKNSITKNFKLIFESLTVTFRRR